MQSIAITAARQIIDGSDQDAAYTIQRMRLTKAQVASIWTTHEQATIARTQLNSVDDEMPTTQEQVDTFTARLNEFKTKHIQLANIFHDLRGADTGADGDDDASPRGRARGKTPCPRRRAGHVGAAPSEREQSG